MRKIRILKKYASILLISSLAISSCSKDEASNNIQPKTENNPISSSSDTNSEQVEQNENLALSEVKDSSENKTIDTRYIKQNIYRMNSETIVSESKVELKADGSVVISGNCYDMDLPDLSKLEKGVKAIFSNNEGFAALKEDGTVVTWGYKMTPEAEKRLLNVEDSLNDTQNPVINIFSTTTAFAALKANGSVVLWGIANGPENPSKDIRNQLKIGVKNIFASKSGFAALRENGSVISWGRYDTNVYKHIYDEKEQRSIGPEVMIDVADQLKKDVKTIFTTDDCFAALKTDGSVVTWGGYEGEAGDSSMVQNQLKDGVATILSNDDIFVAVKYDGSFVTWGAHIANISKINNQLKEGVKTIVHTGANFAALKDNGSVITWGNPWYGGKDADMVAPSDTVPVSKASMKKELEENVKTLISTNGAFAALKNDGSVITWGYLNIKEGEQDFSYLQAQLKDVKTISANGNTFTAVKNDGSIVTWTSIGM